MDTTEHDTPERDETVRDATERNEPVRNTPARNTTAWDTPAEPDGLTIFNDVREVPGEPVAFVGLQLMAVILSYSFALGILVVILVPVALAFTLLWPYLLQILFPAASGW